MNITIFMSLFVIGALVSSLLTEALKKTFNDDISSNIIALVDAGVVGVLGTSAAYILMGIEWNLQNIICLILMVFCIWIGSTVGYDKVLQTLEQIKK